MYAPECTSTWAINVSTLSHHVRRPDRNRDRKLSIRS